jgi:hypothetical protein
MNSGLYNNGIVGFGRALPAWVGSVCGAYLWDGSIAPTDADGVAFEMVGLTPESDYVWGNWLVLVDDWAHPGSAGALVVSSPVFDAYQDLSSMKLWALPDKYVIVQSRPIPLNPVARDPSTGAWPALTVDVIAERDAASAGPLLAEGHVFYFDKTRRTVAGSPDMVWSETPATSFVPRTSWPTFTPPDDACYVAVRLMLVVDVSASGKQIVYFREPALTFVGGEMMNVATHNFASRYVTY